MDHSIFKSSGLDFERAKAEALQRKVVALLGKLRPRNEVEFYRMLHDIMWDVRDELSKRSPVVHQHHLKRLARRVEITSGCLAQQDPSKARECMKLVDRMVWNTRVTHMGTDPEAIGNLLAILSGRSRKLFAMLPKKGNINQTSLLAELGLGDEEDGP